MDGSAKGRCRVIEDAVLADGQIVSKRVLADLSILDSAIVHHHDSMYLDPKQKERVDWVIEKTKGGAVIEVGTATGYVIAKVNASCRRVGVDTNIARLLLAAMRYPNIEFYYANVLNLSSFYKEGFDCVIATEIMEHLPYDHVRHALFHCLTVASRLVVTIPHGDAVMSNPEHLWRPSLELFRESLAQVPLRSKIVELAYVGDFIMLVVERK